MATAAAIRLKDMAAGPPAAPRRSELRLVPTPQASDYILAREAAGGVMPALAKLYERHHRRVYSVCLSMTRNPAQAEDLTQEVFVHLISKIASFRGESQFSTWLHRLTVNRVLMHFRSKGARQADGCDQLKDEIFKKPRTQPAGAQMVERIALNSALKQLPFGCRSVFLLFAIGGYKHDEIAQLLGCSSGTSKSQLHRARMKLRGLLDAK